MVMDTQPTTVPNAMVDKRCPGRRDGETQLNVLIDVRDRM